MSLGVLNVVNAALILSMAKQLVLRDPRHCSCPDGW